MKVNGILKSANVLPAGGQTVEKVAAAYRPLETPRISKPDGIKVKREEFSVLLKNRSGRQ
jgi:hypothetical protein